MVKKHSYKILQKHSKYVWSKNISLLESLRKDKIIYEKIGHEKLKKIFDLKFHTKKVNLIFNRVFK